MEAIAGRIQRLVARQLDAAEVDLAPDCHLAFDLGADPLDVLQLVMAVEAEFGVRVADGDLPELQTLADLTRYVAARREEKRLTPA